jgi:hypothetical protein
MEINKIYNCDCIEFMQEEKRREEKRREEKRRERI